MQDPGFLAGLIGWAIGWAMSGMLHRIKIVYCFRKRLEDFQGCHQSISSSTIGMEKWLEKRHIEQASDIAKNGPNVPWFNVIKRYQMSKSIPELILIIKSARSYLRMESMVKKQSHEPTAISLPQALESPPVFGPSSPPQPKPPPMCKPKPTYTKSSPALMCEIQPAFLPLPPTDEETPSQALQAEEETPSQEPLAGEVDSTEPSQEPLAEEVDSTDHNDVDFSSTKNYKFLKHLLRTINPTMKMVEKIVLRRDNTDSAVAWYKLLQELIEKANNLIDKGDKIRKFDIYSRYRYEKRILNLTERINEHLRLFPFLEMMPASSNDPRESYFHEFSNNPSGS